MEEISILNVVKTWFVDLHRYNITYCHFKSNEHLAEALEGITDLDILIDRSSYTKTVEALNSTGFKRFQTAASINYPAVEDYLGFDEETGKLVHIHLHWQMIAGEPKLKGFRLPWEQQILKHRIFDETNNIYTSSPESELILLLTRAALKLRFRDTIKHLLLNRPYFRSGIERERQWLQKRIDPQKTLELTTDLFNQDVAGMILVLADKEKVSNKDIFAFKKAAWPILKQYRTYKTCSAHLLRWKRELSSLKSKVVKRFASSNKLTRRGPATGGLLIALLGVDGSGKSTHSKGLAKWLGWKTDVKTLYLGSGDGHKSIARRLLMGFVNNIALFKNIVAGKPGKTKSKISGHKNSHAKPSPPLTKRSVLKKLHRSVYALLLAREKQKKLRGAFRARNRGAVIITDRYPQNQIMGFNDGPLLSDFKNASWPWSCFYKREAVIYEKMLLLQPDLVIKLEVTAETARERKKDTPEHMIHRKIEAVKQLTFDRAIKEINLDANRPLEMVLLDIKHSAWSML